MKHLKNISFFLIISLGLTVLCRNVGSDFIFNYLKEDIITLLLTLLAINTATSGLIASKMQDLVVNYPNLDFSATIKEMKFSLLEQIILIIVSIVILVVKDSCLIQFQYKILVCDTVLLAILIYAINVLWDTGKGVFVIIEEIQKMKK